MHGLEVIICTLAGFIITALCGKVLIPYLIKLKFGQTIKEIGPTWHENKQGTPTMGGIMFIIGVVVAVALGYGIIALNVSELSSLSYDKVANTKVFVTLVTAILFGFVGFLDDYIKVVKKRNLGLTAKQKTLFQVLITVAFLFVNAYLNGFSSFLKLPVFGNINLGIFYVPYQIIMAIFIYFMVNAVNLTDGVDGLCGSVTFIVALGYMILSGYMLVRGGAALSASLAGAMLGFLLYNLNPAKVFMGDTGSMFLGGLVTCLAFCLNCEFILFFFGIIYIVEALSVVIQVGYFKITHGKRIFKMSPIHHHFEMSGWSEKKIVAIFTLVTFIAVILGILVIIFF